MPFNDIREFISRLEETGDVQPIEVEVDWDIEAGGIARRCCELSAPAPLFKKIKDYPDGYRIFANPLATFRRLAIAMDLNADASYQEILDTYDDRKANPIKPVLVKDGSCKENICTGDEVDLFKFPAPMVHEGDGGRYIGTWHLVATKDPDSNWVNWGMYRLMIHTKNTLGGFIVQPQHIGVIFDKYEAMNKPMEFAIAIAPEPISTLVATSGVPYGVSEVDIVGGMRGEALNVVKCATVDLVVPATSEIVFEGEVLPGVRKLEGPFGEYTGYRASGESTKPVYQVNAITHRNDPILTMSCMGVAIDDSDVGLNISYASDIRSALKAAGLPITGVYLPPEACCSLCVVATKTPYPNIASKIAGTIWANKNGQWIPKIIVVDDDIDYTNLGAVTHALATKCHPVRGVTILPNTPGNPLIPYYTMEEKLLGLGSNMVFDCTWPAHWPDEERAQLSSFDMIYSRGMKEKILQNWSKYGFK
ncbi:MAG: UbiD family decarboxylase [Thermodesulfobacteriota bacterium]|nr:UbiD family decarboxylase [Thermodesulfobacteriota bacterium]